MRVQDCVKDSWRELLGGKELVNMYGMTEVAGMASMSDWNENTPVVGTIQLYNGYMLIEWKFDRITVVVITPN